MFVCLLTVFTGSAHVWVTNDGGSSWAYAQKLVPADALGGDEFGYSVAIYMNVLAVGARFKGSMIVITFFWRRRK